MPFPHAILADARFVGKSGRADDGPVESALPKDIFHSRCIGDYILEKQPTEKVRWRDDGVLEQECHRLDHDAPDSHMYHGARQCDCEALQKVPFSFRNGLAWTEPRSDGVVTLNCLSQLGAV